MKLSDIMVNEAIVPKLEATTRDEVIVELVKALAEAGAIAKGKVGPAIEAVLARESQATTGIIGGLAFPHAKLKGITSPVGTIGRSGAGVEFAALDAKPVYSVILLLSNPDNPDEHLQAMEAIFKHVSRDMFRKFLQQSQTRQAVIDLIEEADELA